jgi:uncharacterized membrane protein HdeD (DUF308 family)
MKAYSEYWATTMIRGLLAIVAGTGVLFIPQMASTILRVFSARVRDAV